MSMHPSFEISRLRDIGWRAWDPICILPSGDSWERHPEFADEYDPYLMEAAWRLSRDWSVSEAAEYLALIEVEHMGLGLPPGSSARARAEATAKAIKLYVDNLFGV